MTKFSSDPFDLVLTDFQMPGMDGWEWSINIKKKSPGTPIVMITGETQVEIIRKARQGG